MNYNLLIKQTPIIDGNYSYSIIRSFCLTKWFYYNSVNRIIKRIATAVGLPPCRVHDFRHSYASILFEHDFLLKDVSQLLGHGQTSTTERIYVHKKRVGNIESINTLANVIGF